MENNIQFKKSLKSYKTIESPIILMSYDDSSANKEEDNNPKLNLENAVLKSIDDIVKKYGDKKSILLIGRFNYDGEHLCKNSRNFTFTEKKQIKCNKYPSLKLDFLTAHSSKGLGYDNVIIINAKDHEYGFPAKIDDDPIIQLLFKNTDEIDYGEERRLFYVALTRTKNRVYIVTPQKRPSKFILEIKGMSKNVNLVGDPLTPTDKIDIKYTCPVCGYPLQLRQSKNKYGDVKRIWVCSNDDEVCGFLTNDINGGPLSISKCPECNDGYLIVKQVKDKNKYMLGCTNFKNDGSGCNCHIFSENYTQNKKDMMNINGSLVKSELNKYIKEITLAINDVYSKYTSFKFSYNSLVNFLLGKEDKTIKMWKLKESKSFGILANVSKDTIIKVVSFMVQYGRLKEIKDDKYINLDIIDNQIDPSFILANERNIHK